MSERKPLVLRVMNPDNPASGLILGLPVIVLTMVALSYFGVAVALVTIAACALIGKVIIQYLRSKQETFHE